MEAEEKGKTIETQLSVTWWIRISLVLMLTLLVGVSVAWMSPRSAAQPRNEIIVVHSGESKTLHYNPLTHEEVRHEMADGCFMLTVKPKVD